MQSIAAVRCGLFFAVPSPLAWAQACCPAPAEAMPLAMQKDLGKKADDFKHEAQAVATRPPPRPIRHPRRHIGTIIVVHAARSAGGTAAVACAPGDGGYGQ